MIDSVRGVLRVRKWPRKRGPPKKATQAFWVDWFRQANRLAKYADGMSQVRAKEMTEGSGMYPRDVLLKAMRGRLYLWTTPDGWKWYSMAAIGDVSESLDVLAQTVGNVLVRAADRWRSPPNGNVGDVLTFGTLPAAPAWAAPVGTGGFVGGALAQKSANQTVLNGTFTIITWNTEVYDTGAIHDNVTNNSRMTVPTGTVWVRLSAGIIWDSNSTGGRIMQFVKNGAGLPAGIASLRSQAYRDSRATLVSAPMPVVATDYFELQVHQDSGGTRTVNTSVVSWFAMELL